MLKSPKAKAPAVSLLTLFLYTKPPLEMILCASEGRSGLWSAVILATIWPGFEMTARESPTFATYMVWSIVKIKTPQDPLQSSLVTGETDAIQLSST